jgi:hypothetical protein
MKRLAFLAVVACLCGCALAGTGRADTIITTPAGLVAGDHFFVVFVDSNGHPATSTNIADYNNFIQTDAGVIHYPGGTIGTWHVIGSTDATNEATPLFTDTSTPVYDTTNTLLASSGAAELANGAIQFDQNGASQSGGFVFTGLLSDGTTSTGSALGDVFVRVGDAGSPGGDAWGGGLEALLSTQSRDLYGYALFTVGPASAAPEPASLTLLGVGVLCLAGYGWRQRRRTAPERRGETGGYVPGAASVTT